MSVYKCYDCITVVCLDCFRKHKDQQHLLQLISDSFILNDKFTLSGKLSPLMEIAYLPGGLLVVVYNGDLNSYSVSGIHTHVKSFVEQTDKIAVVDKSTVAVILVNSYLKVAMVNLQQNNIQYLEYEDILMNFPSSIIYIENQLYVADNFGINIIDLSRTVKERIELSFIPRYMCYDVDLQRIYCVDRDSIKLICIDRDGTVQFTFADPNWTNIKSLTIDNSGNVLVICVKGDDDFMCVAKVDCDGKSSDVVISNIKMSSLYPNTCMCFHHLNNSVVIGRRNTVYIYEKEAKV